MKRGFWSRGLYALALVGAAACGAEDDGGDTGNAAGGPFAGAMMPPAPAAGAAQIPGDMLAMGAAGAAAPAQDATRDPAQQPPGAVGDDGAAAQPPGTAMQPPAGDAASDAVYDYVGQDVALDADLVVASGETLRVGPGTTFRAAAGVTLRVDGTLLVTGSADAPARFLGAGVPRSWEGIVVSGGGELQAEHIEIGGATYGIHALPGSSFAVDYADIGTSFKAAVVQSDGSFDHTAFHASGDPTFSISSAAPITDPNGTLTIVDGSPTVRNSTFDSGAPLVDMVRVRGNSQAVLENVYITDAHCGIHMEGGPNNSPQVRGAIFDGMAYGVMAYATRPVIEDSVFMNNATDVGFCVGATADNVPQLSNNYYSAGAPLFDASCVAIGIADAAPASAPNADAGPAGL